LKHTWKTLLPFDPVPPLLACGNEAIVHFARRDLQGETPGSARRLWALPAVDSILRKQQRSGAWKYRGGRKAVRSEAEYDQLETYRQLGCLVEKYGMQKKHPGVEKAADFLFRFQTEAGDFRGIYGRQYTPNYTGGILEILVKAGYRSDPRITPGFQWLLSTRQQKTGWAIPVLTVGGKLDIPTLHTEAVAPSLSRPPSHLVTGCVLRAFAAHSRYRRTRAARTAGEYLASKLMKRGEYPGRQSVDFWTRFTFPFWFTDLLSALDSLSNLGFPGDHPRIREGLAWLARHQDDTGGWSLRMLKDKSDPHLNHWLDLSVCRVFKRFHSAG